MPDIICSQCGEAFPADWLASRHRRCPLCGGLGPQPSHDKHIEEPSPWNENAVRALEDAEDEHADA